MFHWPPPTEWPPRRSRPVRVIVAVSHPVVLAMLALTCLALWLSRVRVPPATASRSHPEGWSLWRSLNAMARALLHRWPYLVVVVIGVGVAEGLLFMGPAGIWWGVASTVVGAGIAPVLVPVLPRRWFDRGGHR
jgi:hypothetical protein